MYLCFAHVCVRVMLVWFHLHWHSSIQFHSENITSKTNSFDIFTTNLPIITYAIGQKSVLESFPVYTLSLVFLTQQYTIWAFNYHLIRFCRNTIEIIPSTRCSASHFSLNIILCNLLSPPQYLQFQLIGNIQNLLAKYCFLFIANIMSVCVCVSVWVSFRYEFSIQ